jgi:AraC-like DNA-binding protein
MAVNDGARGGSELDLLARARPGARVRRLRLDRVENLAAILGRHSTVCPLGPGEFAFEAVSVDLGQLSVHVGHSTPLLLQASVPQDMVCFVLALAGARLFHLNGREVQPRSLAIHGPGAMHMGASHVPVSWAVIAVNAADAADVLPSRPGRLGRSGTSATVLTGRSAWVRTASLLHALNDVAASEPDVFEVEEARRSLRASILQALRELLDPPPGGDRLRVMRQSDARERVILAADEYIRLNSDRALTALQVAGALGIPAARLRHAVRATFGMSASRFLSTRRLLALRAALLDAGQDPVTRRAIASARGFWNLPALEAQYRALFHEPLIPSCRPAQANARAAEPGRRIA